MTRKGSDLQKKVVLSAASESQSTHGTAAQASAARLIRMLRETYPGVINTDNTHPSTGTVSAAGGGGAASIAFIDPISAQGYLCRYLTHLINTPHTAFSREPAYHRHRSIASTIRVIDEINTTYTDLDAKKTVFQMLLSIAQTHPGLTWRESDAQWSMNKFYNTTTKQEEIVTSSPAEALNLCCTAIYDWQHMPALPGGDIDRDRTDRIASLCTYLVNLHTEEQAGNYEVCAAGRQHALLFLLDGVFCEKVHEGPVVLVIDQNAFIFNTLSEFIKEQLLKAPPAKSQEVVSHWVLSNTGQLHCEVEPVIAFLRERFPADDGDNEDAAWKAALTEYLKDKCGRVGLHPDIITEAKVDEYEKNLIYLQPPTVSPLLDEIMRSQEIPATGRLDNVIEKRNQALQAFKTRYQSNPPSISDKEIESFFLTETLFQTLYKNRHDALLLGDNLPEYRRARQAVEERLTAYFQEGSLAADFNTAREAYLSQYEILHQAQEPIENFFVRNAANITVDSLNALPRELCEISDDVLAQWRAENTSSGVLEVSPYEANRIVLRALLTVEQSGQWSDVFKEALRDVIMWILNPPAVSSVSESAFRRAYREDILKNLLYLSLARDIDRRFETHPPSGAEILRRFLSYFSDRFSPVGRGAAQSLDVNTFNELFTAVKRYFNTLLGNDAYYPFLRLLGLDQLTDEQRTEILNNIDLTRHIRSVTDFLGVLAISALQESHRDQIWNKIEEQEIHHLSSEAILRHYLSTNNIPGALSRSPLTPQQLTKIFYVGTREGFENRDIIVDIFNSEGMATILNRMEKNSDCLQSLLVICRHLKSHELSAPYMHIVDAMRACFHRHQLDSENPLDIHVAKEIIAYFEQRSLPPQPGAAAGFFPPTRSPTSSLLGDPSVQAYRNQFQEESSASAAP